MILFNGVRFARCVRQRYGVGFGEGTHPSWNLIIDVPGKPGISVWQPWDVATSYAREYKVPQP